MLQLDAVDEVLKIFLIFFLSVLKGVVPWIFQKILNAIFVFSVKNWSRKYILFRLKEVLFLEI